MLGYMHVRPYKCEYRRFFFLITSRNYILNNLEFFRHHFLHNFEYFWAGYFFQSFFKDITKICNVLLENLYIKYATNPIICGFLRFFFPFLKSIYLETRDFTEADLKILKFFFDETMVNKIEKFSFFKLFYSLIFAFFIVIYKYIIQDFYYNIFFSLRLRIYFYKKLYSLHNILIGAVIRKRLS